DRIAGAGGDLDCLLTAGGGGSDRLRDFERLQGGGEPAPVFGQVDRLHGRAEDADAALLERAGQVDGRLAAELDDRAARPLRGDHIEHGALVERLEVEAVGGVEVGRD